MPLPYKAHAIGDSAIRFIACMAFTERRYRQTPARRGNRRAGSLLPYFQVTPSTVEDVMTVRPAGKS